MAPRRILALLAILALSGCWGGTASMTRGPQSRIFETPPRPRRPAAWELREPTIPGRPYADTPITAFAESITDFALAAAFHQPLPAPPVPTRHPLGVEPVIDWGTTPRPARLEALAVAVDVEFILKRGDPEDAAPDERWGTVHATLVVTRNGIRVVSLRPGAIAAPGRGGALPSGMRGLASVAHALMADLRRGDALHYELNEADRRLLANDGVWAQLREDGPALARARQIGAMLQRLPDAPLAYVLDDIGVLARDEDDRLYGLSLDLDPRGDTFALATTPLVSIRRLWPRD